MRRSFSTQVRYGSGPDASIRGMLLAVTWLMLCGPAWAESLLWDRLADGLDITLWTPPSSCLDVPPLVAVSVDPSRYRFSVHYYRNERLEGPPDIHEWQARTQHDLIFNAGLFRENFSYLGLLFGNGQSLGGKQHGTWLGLFAAEPTVPGVAPARIVDLSTESFDEERPPYREAAQSLMLFDETGKIRVRRTGKYAQQTVIAEQDNGRILLFKTTQTAALHDLGQCLQKTFPRLRRAMAMDGGSSSDIALAPALRQGLNKAGRTPEWVTLLDNATVGHIGLPAVIGISPRGEKPSDSALQEQRPGR